MKLSNGNLKKLQKGVAMIEYAVLLSFLIVIAVCFLTSDFSNSIGGIMNKNVENVANALGNKQDNKKLEAMYNNMSQKLFSAFWKNYTSGIKSEEILQILRDNGNTIKSTDLDKVQLLRDNGFLVEPEGNWVLAARSGHGSFQLSWTLEKDVPPNSTVKTMYYDTGSSDFDKPHLGYGLAQTDANGHIINLTTSRGREALAIGTGDNTKVVNDTYNSILKQYYEY